MDLVKVTHNLYFYPAEKGVVPDNPKSAEAASFTSQLLPPSDSCSVILIFGWMDAQISHLRKYMEQYKILFPNARQILVRCQANVFWTSEAEKLKDMEPVRALLQEEGLLEHSQARILIHAFSNGGAHRLTLLSKLLAKEQQLASMAVGLIYDSLPGAMESLSILLPAFTTGIRSSFLRYLAYIPLTLLWAHVRISLIITGTPNAVEESRVLLNSQNPLPWITPSTPRLYIYSSSDKITLHDAVEAHIEQAKKAGLNVMAEKFEGSSHVGHMRKDPERYWKAVKELWRTATSH